MSSRVMVCKNKTEASRVLETLAPEQMDMVKDMQMPAAPVIIVVVNGKHGEVEVKNVTTKKEDSLKLRLHNLVMDLRTARVWVNKKELTLTALEYRLLRLFMSAPGKVFSRKDIFEACWDDNYMEDDGTINVHMSHIRKKIRKFDADNNYIRTVRGIGFAME